MPYADPQKKRAWRFANKEHLRQYNIKYEHTHHEQRKATAAAWRAAHPEKKSAKRQYAKRHYRENTERRKRQMSAWWAAHPQAHVLYEMRRRLRKILNGGGCNLVRLQARIDFYGGRCWIPGCAKPYEAIDHVIPLAKGGSNWPANLRPICKSHNSQKRDMMPNDFLLSDGNLRVGPTIPEVAPCPNSM